MHEIKITFIEYVDANYIILAGMVGEKDVADRLIAESTCPLSPVDIVGIWHAVIAKEVANGKTSILWEVTYNVQSGAAQWSSYDATQPRIDLAVQQSKPA